MNQQPSATMADSSDTAPGQDPGTRVVRALLVLITMLVAVGFTMPISENWRFSAQDYDEFAENMEAHAREGNKERQLALAAVGLVGLIGVAWPARRGLRIAGLVG